MRRRVVVVGAGIVGTCVGLRLAKQGADVTLVEAEAPGAGTSGTSFAWLDASHPSLAPYVGLNLAGLDAWRRLGDGIGSPSWLALTGTLAWETRKDAAGELSQRACALRERGHPAIELSRRQVSELEPDLIVDPSVESVVMYPAEGYLWPRPAIADLIALGRRWGLRVRTECPVASFDGDGRGVTGVQLGSGEHLPADVVVTCLGRWTPPVVGNGRHRASVHSARARSFCGGGPACRDHARCRALAPGRLRQWADDAS